MSAPTLLSARLWNRSSQDESLGLGQSLINSFQPGSNLYNVLHGVVHVLARGTTRCRDDAFDFTTEKTHGLYSDFSWEGESTGV